MFVALLTLVLVPAACGDDDDAGSGSSGGSAGDGDDGAEGGECQEPNPDTCESCEGNETLWICFCEIGPPALPVAGNYLYPCRECIEGLVAAEEHCENKCKAVAGDGYIGYDPFGVPCFPEPDDGVDSSGDGQDFDCTRWDPGAEVSVVGGVHQVEVSFVDDLIDDPSPLTECDDAWLAPLSGSRGFEVKDADPRELLYELGLRDGDVPVTLNSLPLYTWQDAADAFAALYLSQNETEYFLRVNRGSTTITLEYELQ